MAQMFSPIAKLPTEILTDILTQVRYVSSQSSFLGCLLCCKRWLHVALHLLYQGILLKSSSLDAFLKTFPRENLSRVQSLTVLLDPEVLIKGLYDENFFSYIEEEENGLFLATSEKTRLFWRRLGRITTRLSSMANLSSFSLNIPKEKDPAQFWLPSPVIVSILESLPESCVNLEIDTQGHDHDKPGGAHICDTLRRIVPRLHHLRLRLQRLCPALFGSRFGIDDSGSFSLTPTAAPYLRTAVINCALGCLPGDGFAFRACYKFQVQAPDRTYLHSVDGASVLVTCLRQIIAASLYPAIELLWVLECAGPYSRACSDKSYYDAFYRRNIIEGKTWVLPIRSIHPKEDDSILIRMPEKQEFLSYYWALEALAEGEAWKDTINGHRLPAALAATPASHTEGYRAKPLPLLSPECYRARSPNHTCRLWNNEEKAGVRLLDAGERKCLMDTILIRESTPAGWIRSWEDIYPDDF